MSNSYERLLEFKTPSRKLSEQTAATIHPGAYGCGRMNRGFREHPFSTVQRHLSNIFTTCCQHPYNERGVGYCQEKGGDEPSVACEEVKRKPKGRTLILL